MYLTQTDIAQQRLLMGRIKSDTELLKDLIEKDAASQEKINMKDGENYYVGKQKILDHDFRVYDVNGVSLTDKDKSNNKLVHTYHKLLVDQKTGYIAKNPITITTDPEDVAEDIEQQLGENRHDKLNDWITGTSNKGVEYMHVYYDIEGNFRYTIIDAREIIPIYDTNYEAEIVEVIRYYDIDIIENGETQTRKRVEWWTAEDVTFYVETENENFIKDPSEEINPKGHYQLSNDTNGVAIETSWGKVPFVPLYNNSKQTTDLEPIKTLIDDFDFNTSDASNNLADLQEAIWVLMGYDGEKLSDFRKNLKTFKAIKVSEDGKAEPLTLDIPMEARDSHLDRLEGGIYTFGMGVDMSTDKFGNSPSGIALKFLFSLLDLKAKTLERKLQTALSDLMWFVLTSLDLDPDSVTVKFTFDYSMLMNETELITNLVNSTGMIPQDNILEKHPYVQNVEEAKEKLEDEGTINLEDDAD